MSAQKIQLHDIRSVLFFRQVSRSAQETRKARGDRRFDHLPPERWAAFSDAEKMNTLSVRDASSSNLRGFRCSALTVKEQAA